MCLLISLIAGIIFFGIYSYTKSKGKSNKSLMTTAIMFSSAALMWCVDGITSVMEGESFLEISREDTILGFIVVGFGILAYIVLSLCEKRKKA